LDGHIVQAFRCEYGIRIHNKQRVRRGACNGLSESCWQSEFVRRIALSSQLSALSSQLSALSSQLSALGSRLRSSNFSPLRAEMRSTICALPSEPLKFP
jgi:hypothetical protein